MNSNNRRKLIIEVKNCEITKLMGKVKHKYLLPSITHTALMKRTKKAY